MASKMYTRGLHSINNGTIDPDTATTKIGLAKSAYVPNANESNLSTFAASEADCANYTGGYGGAGRKAATVTLTETAGVKDVASFADLTWTALGSGNTLGYAVWLYETGGSDATAVGLAFFAFASTLATNGGDVMVDFATAGAGGNVSWTV